ncbi:LacI family DNA-binding transcriptional regulator [Kineococcus sp. SYSU DK001]|uniref:LacI family DNA-binding transcriptional regulator n=1 Tax=Kineococcus sp. SYSU DK001 TaxID=3383122 RepID=UPI003D7D5DEF
MNAPAPRPPRRAATLADVAQAAGVSLATASKALNGRRDVGAATRARVTEVARSLDFAPNQLARSLMSGRTGSVGLLTDDLEGRFALPVMIGAEDALGEAETVALLANSRGRPDLEQRHLSALLGRRIDGLLLVGKGPEPRAPLPRTPSGVATVYAYAPSSDPADTSFVCDHRGAGRLAAEHLLAVGCRRIAHVGGPVDGQIGHLAAELRALGTADALADHGLPLVTGSALHGEWLERWGWAATERLLASEEFDGLVCGNDQIARGAVDLLTTRGVRVPGDVAVVGFDNTTAIAAHGRLPQTTVDMNLYEVGRTAASALLDPATLRAGEQQIPGRLVVRESSRR